MRPWFPTFAGVIERGGEGVSALRHRYQKVNLRRRGRYSGLSFATMGTVAELGPA